LEAGVNPVVAIIDDDQSVREGISYLVNSMGLDAEAFERPEQSDPVTICPASI
jgi:FixJ family two-component response regulator